MLFLQVANQLCAILQLEVLIRHLTMIHLKYWVFLTPVMIQVKEAYREQSKKNHPDLVTQHVF